MTIAKRIADLERKARPTGRTVLVIRDELGHVLYPDGAPRPGDEVDEIVIGGIDIERDL
jgi:hypothetical protein